MKVLLVSPNRERIPDPVFPLGLAYVASAVRKAGHVVDVLDLCFAPDIEKAITEKISAFSPGMIGLSLRNIDDVSYPKSVCYIDLYREVMQIIRRATQAPVILGGAGFTIMPEAFMRELGADYGVAGEGEAAFGDFVTRYEQGYRPDDPIIRTGGKDCGDWSATMPDRSLFDAAGYYQYGGMLNIQTKRGCPFGCIYCSYPLIEGRQFRTRPAEDIVDELEAVVAQAGVRHFFFVDSIFNHPVEFAGEVSDAIVRRGLDIRWTCYANAAYMTPRLAEKMRRAGCTSVEFGTDSMLDDTLALMKKGFTFGQIREASAVCRDADIKFCHFVFVGAPGDTRDRVRLNLERLESLGADVSVIMTGIRIFPNTALAAIAERELGIRPQDITIRPLYYIAPDVIREIDAIVADIRERHPKWILPGFEVNISERLQALLRRKGIKGSLWEEFIRR